jgi:hypothetical protein
MKTISQIEIDKLIEDYELAQANEIMWRQAKNDLLLQLNTIAEVQGAKRLLGEKKEIIINRSFTWDIPKIIQTLSEHETYAHIFDKAYKPAGERPVWFESKIDGNQLKKLTSYGDEATQMYESFKIPTDKLAKPKIERRQ